MVLTIANRLVVVMQAAPIVRVAVEAALPSELPRLVDGLRLLNRADPFLEVTLQDKGEYVLGAAGLSLSVQLSCICVLSKSHPPPLSRQVYQIV